MFVLDFLSVLSGQFVELAGRLLRKFWQIFSMFGCFKFFDIVFRFYLPLLAFYTSTRCFLDSKFSYYFPLASLFGNFGIHNANNKVF